MVLALFLAVALAFTPTHVCERRNGKTIKVANCKPLAPVPTPTQKAPSCADGSLTLDAAGRVFSRRRSYEPGREYRMCARIPDAVQAPNGWLQLTSVNHANAGCNVYWLTLVSPSGKRYPLARAIQHGTIVPFEPGTWGVEVRLDAEFARCDGNPPLTMYLWWL